MKTFALSLLMMFFLISSCGAVKSEKPIPQPLPSPSDTWTVTMTQSGGIAGVLLTVEVSNDGQLKAEDQRSHRIITKTLSTQTTNELKSLVFNLPASVGRLPQSACADCFIYDLDIQSEGKNTQIHVDDVTLNDSGAQKLITTLAMLRDSALKPSP